MSEKGDWIRLLVKYKGKCVQCGKEIPQGDYALWSRLSKAIKHVKCDMGDPSTQAETAVSELECYICGKSAGCVQCGFESDCNRAIVSQACLCNQCLSEKDAYGNYQEAFLSKMHKLTKGKI